MNNETPQIETLYRQVRGDHEQRLIEAERRRHHTGGRPLRPGLRQAANRLASWVAAVVRPRTRQEPAVTEWPALARCEAELAARPRTGLLR